MFQDPVPVLVPDPGNKGGSGSGRIREKCNRNRIQNKTCLVIIFAMSQESSNIWNNFSENTNESYESNCNTCTRIFAKKLCYFKFHFLSYFE